jgi:hypothetical protein
MHSGGRQAFSTLKNPYILSTWKALTGLLLGVVWIGQPNIFTEGELSLL